MAFLRDVWLNGRMGDRVYYTRNGKRISRRIPETVHKTPNMKKRSANFGIASRAAGVIRKLLIDVLPFPTDRDMQNKFGGSLAGGSTPQAWVRFT